MNKIRVGVVRGGPSSEYPVSLKTGDHVLRQLDTLKYAPIDILLSTHGEWYMNGALTDLATISAHVDVIWNALHGEYGEDGKLQQELDYFNIPYTGSGALASSLGMHKGLAKERFKEAGLTAPEGDLIPKEEVSRERAFELFRGRHLPLIVKPVSGGSSIATAFVNTFEELDRAIHEASQFGDVLVEEVIEGKEATVCVIDGSGKGEHFVLYPIEIVPPSDKTFFDYDAKYSGESAEICPGRFPLSVHSELRDLATKAHIAIGAKHYSRTDFIVSPKGIYILEINTLPGLTEESLLPKALKKGGVAMPDFLDHVIGLALAQK